LKNQWNRSTVRRPSPRRPVHRNFIKPGPSFWRSAAWIKWAEGVFHILISAVGWHVDGGKHFFSLGLLGWDRAREAPWLVAWASSISSYGARNNARFLPTWSRLWEELVLWTYRSENRPREAGDGEASRAVFNDGGDGVQRCSISKDSSGGDGVGGGSSKRWIGTGVSSVAARQQCRGSAMAARVRPNLHGIGHYL
jgi:hypothetical protein